ncbi:hypothetical protein DFQ30_001683 [Apophysomyces sp. BC1015]|nr:hypothetical protein DFQ30_001683 [Apophysomyces sp. BC1015]
MHAAFNKYQNDLDWVKTQELPRDVLNQVAQLSQVSSVSDLKEYATSSKQLQQLHIQQTGDHGTMILGDQNINNLAAPAYDICKRKRDEKDYCGQDVEETEEQEGEDEEEEEVSINPAYISPDGHVQYAVPLDFKRYLSSRVKTKTARSRTKIKQLDYLRGNGVATEIVLSESHSVLRIGKLPQSVCKESAPEKDATIGGFRTCFKLHFFMDENAAEEFAIDPVVWNHMHGELKLKYQLKTAPEHIEQKLCSFAKAARRNYAECRRMPSTWLEADAVEASNVVNNMYGRIVVSSLRLLMRTCRLQSYSLRASSTNDINEDTFVMNVIRPAFIPFLQETRFIKRNGCDARLDSSKRRRILNGESRTSRFADLSMKYQYGDLEELLLAIEVKPPKKLRKMRRPDFTKLANEMKDSIDKMIGDGLNSSEITCLGILVEGHKCTLLVMDLRFHFVYRLFPVSVFHLPQDHNDFWRLVDVYEALDTAKDLLLQTGRTCHQSYMYAINSNRREFTVPSFSTPTKRKEKDDNEEEEEA